MKRTALGNGVYQDEKGRLWCRPVLMRGCKKFRTWRRLRATEFKQAVTEAAKMCADEEIGRMASDWISKNGQDPRPDYMTLPKPLKKYGMDIGRMTVTRNSPCVYFLMRGNKCVYVGKTDNSLYVRIGTHLSDKFFDHVYFVEVPKEKLSEVEMAYISLLSPMYNTIGVRRTGSLPKKKCLTLISVMPDPKQA